MNVRIAGRRWQRLVGVVITAAIPGIAAAAPPEAPRLGGGVQGGSSSKIVIRTAPSSEPKVLDVPGPARPIVDDSSKPTASPSVAPPSIASPVDSSGVNTSVPNVPLPEPWTHWEGGRAMWRGAKVDGRKQGPWTRWVYDSEGPMFDDVHVEGFARPFVIEGSFKDDRLEGTCSVLDKNGRAICRLSFKGGELDGPLAWFYANGKPRIEEHYRDGRLEGRARQWNDVHHLTRDEQYERGRRLGHHVEKYPTDRTMVEGDFYLAGDVMRTSFDWSAGRLDTMLETTLTSDQRTGLWTWWHPNGQKQLKGTYRDNLPDGTFVSYYQNAQKESEGTFVAGKQHGLWATWYMNGQKESEGRYVNGEQAGPWMAWTTAGQRQSPPAQTAKSRSTLLR